MVLEDAKFQDQDFDSNVNRSWGTEINIEGTSYATSLFWQPLQNKDDPYAEVEEASAGVLEGADLFCIKPGKAPHTMPAYACLFVSCKCSPFFTSLAGL